METKVVKLEIGKLLAFVIAVVVVASVAGVVIQNNYFKGSVPGVDSGAYSVEDSAEVATRTYFDRIEMFKIDIEKLGYDKALSGLKYDLDVMVSEKIIGSEIAQETFVAFSSIDDSKVAVAAIDDSILAAKSDIDGFINAIDVSLQTAVQSLESAVLIDQINALAIATTVDAIAVADVKESFVDLGISEIETIKFDAPLLEAISISVSFDSALEILNNDIEAGIEPAIYFDKFDSALETIKQDVAIDVTGIELMNSIEVVGKDIGVQLDTWAISINALTIDSVAIDNDVLAKAIDSGKGFDVLAKSFNGFVINIEEKGMGIDLAVATLAKDIGGIMPGLLIIDAVKLK